MRNFIGRDGFIWWIGIIEDVDDPLKLGRCKVRCFGYHSDKNDRTIMTQDLPWATVLMSPNASRTYSPLKPGAWVVGFFFDSTDAQEPVIMGYIPGIGNSSKYKNFSAPLDSENNLKGWQNYTNAIENSSFGDVREIYASEDNISPINVHIISVPDGDSTLNKSHKIIIHGSNNVSTSNESILGGGALSKISFEHSNGSYITMTGEKDLSLAANTDNVTKITMNKSGLEITDGKTQINKITMANNVITINHSSGSFVKIKNDGEIELSSDNLRLTGGNITIAGDTLVLSDGSQTFTPTTLKSEIDLAKTLPVVP